MKKAIFEYHNDIPIMRCNMPGCKFIYYVDFHTKKYLIEILSHFELSQKEIDSILAKNNLARRRAFVMFKHHKCTWRDENVK